MLSKGLLLGMKIKNILLQAQIHFLKICWTVYERVKGLISRTTLMID